MAKEALWLIILSLLTSCSLAEEAGSLFREKIESGQSIDLKDCKLSDTIKIEEFNLSKDAQHRSIINSSMRLENCEINGRLDFGLAVFKKPIIFKNVIFYDGVNFARSKFDGSCSFSNSDFKKPSRFDGVNFTNSVYFIQSQFENPASFSGSLFYRGAYFQNIKFMDDANFRDARFFEAANFQEAEFYKSAIFSRIKSNGTLNFQASKFYDIFNLEESILGRNTIFAKSLFGSEANFKSSKFINASFYASKFHDIANFPDSIFKNDAVFTGAKFEGPADFSSANFFGLSKFDAVEFNKVVKFNNANFSGNASFFGAYFDRDARFEGASFGSRLNLTDATFNQLAISWESIRNHLIKDKGTNLSLINNYKSMGWIKDRNECYYDYRDDRRASSEWGPSKILDSASWAYWGYGVRPYNAVMSILVIIFSFGLIYRSLVYFNFARVIRKNGRRDDEEAPTQIEQDNLDSKVALAKTDSLQSQSRISFKEALFFSTRTLLLKSPGNIRIEGMYARYAIWIQQVIFGFFVVLFIVFFNEEVQSYFKPPT